MGDRNKDKLLRRLRELALPEGRPGRWPGRWPWDEKPDKPGSWDEKPQKPGSWDEVPKDRHGGH